MISQRRNTKTKQQVMTVLENSTAALSHEDIERRLLEKIDRVTIYRILQRFCEDGKLHTIIDKDGKTRYALCHNCTAEHHSDNHPHFHCLSCDELTCVAQPTAPQKLPMGYTPISVSSYILGYCQKCSGAAKMLCLLLCLCMAHSSFAQWRVQVLSSATNEGIPSARVYFPDSRTGTLTDSLGFFRVNSTAPQVLVHISAEGFQSLLQRISPNDQSPMYLQPSTHELREVVVSGNVSRLQGETVMNVEKLNLNNAGVQGASLAEKLTSIAGVDNLSTGVGIGKPTIRGMSGNRIAVFSQGVRIENQQWGDEHGLGLDEHGYEQVEVIKGPASVLYGSDALGGVLYFVDERYAKQNSVEAALQSEFASNALGFRNNGTLKISKERFHWNAFGGYTTFMDYATGTGDRVPNSRFNTGNFKTTLGYTGNRFSSALKYSFLREKFGLTEGEEEDESAANEEVAYNNGRTPLLPYQDLFTHIVSSENTMFFDNGSKIKMDVGYVFNNRKEFEGEEGEEENEAALNMNLHTLSYNAKWYSPRRNNRWNLIAGSQGMAQDNSNAGEEILIPDAQTFDFGAFAMSDFYYAEKAYWQLGVRYDTRLIRSKEFDNQYNSFNFSTGIFQPLSETLSFRANLASGFRAPNMFELLSDGKHEGTFRYEIGNPDLKTENSYQIDAAANYKSKHVEVFVNPYFDYIKNFIHLDPSDDMREGVPVFYYAQSDAFLYGGEAGFHVHPHPLDWLHVEGLYSSTFGQNVDNQNLALMPSQKLKATLSANFRFETSLRRFSVYVQNVYSLAQNLVAEHESKTPAYTVLNVGALCEFAVKHQIVYLNVSAQNILNETYYDHLSRYKSEGIFNPGRSVNVKLSIPLSFNL
ncbi:MAG: TonB-dependent receptor [Bacteroidales bacterium]|jgi:iron complex outermembrane receptor protein|nr:TonB-dependent receptor [Bacteroidales bacterium]